MLIAKHPAWLRRGSRLVCRSAALLIGLSVCSSLTAGLADQWRLVYGSVISADGLTALTSQVTQYDPTTSAIASGYAIVEDGLGINAFERIGTDERAFVVNRHFELPNGDLADPRTIVVDNAGSFSIAFDGAAAGIPAGVKIDALFRDSGGQWIISTDIHVELDGTVYADGDLIGHDGTGFFLVASEAELGLETSADVTGITQGTGGRWLVTLASGGQTLDGLVYFSGDVLSGDSAGRLSAIELSSREAPFSVTAGLNAISAEPAPDELFSDRFQEG